MDGPGNAAVMHPHTPATPGMPTEPEPIAQVNTGMRVFDANPKVEEALKERGRLWHREAFYSCSRSRGVAASSGAGTGPP